MSLEGANCALLTGKADVTVEGDVKLADGKLSSTGGTLLFRKGGLQSGAFEFDLGESTLSLSGSYTKSGGTLSSASATLKLLDNITVSSNSAIYFNKLELFKKTICFCR